MSEWHPIIAGPGFDGLDRMVWGMAGVFAVWLLTSVYTTFRLSTIRERKRRGLLFWCAAALAIGGILYVPLMMILR